MKFYRSLIEKIVHCSIMKLNENSMTKLVDLMLMGFKLQVINCTQASEIYDITQNHFNGILNILNSGQGIEYMISIKKKFEDYYSQLNCFEFLIIK